MGKCISKQTTPVSPIVLPNDENLVRALPNMSNIKIHEKQFNINPAKLSDLVKYNDTKILLVDCRSEERFRDMRINHDYSINVLLSIHHGFLKPAERFVSTASVITFLREQFPLLLTHLKLPGHFSNIVLIVDMVAEEDEKILILVQQIVAALEKWNQDQQTIVQILQEGFSAFSKEFPSLICSDDLFSTEFKPGTVRTFRDLRKDPETTPDPIEDMIFYLEDLDDAISVLEELIVLREKIVSLQMAHSVLYLEISNAADKCAQQMGNLIPEDVRCPVCLEIFMEDVFQCGNGHCICSCCSQKLTECPKCGLDLQNTVRNLALENLISNSFRVDCVCGKWLKLKTAKAHLIKCTKKRNLKEILELEMEIKDAENDIPALNEKLKRISTKIAESETKYSSGTFQSEGHIGQVSWKKFCDYRFTRKSIICSLEQTLMSLIYCDKAEDSAFQTG